MWIISQIRIFLNTKKEKKNSMQTMINKHKRKLTAGNKEILYNWLLRQKSKNSTHFKT